MRKKERERERRGRMMIKWSNEKDGMIGGTEGDALSSLLIYLVCF